MALAQRLNDLIEKINIISRQRSTNAICILAGQHIVELFHFDYAVISLFDFKKRKIISKKERSYANPKKDLGLNHPDNWVSDSAYNEEDNDILIKVLRTQRNIQAVGRHIIDHQPSASIPDPSFERITFSCINKTIFETYEHDKLARFYIPIIYRGLKEDNSIDLPIGVIEIGIREEEQGQFSTDDRDLALENFKEVLMDKYPNPELLEKLLQLYTDNFAQPCHAAIVEEESRALLEQLRIVNEEKNNNAGLAYDAYAKAFIKKITDSLHADWGVIALKTYHNNHINYFDKGTYFSQPQMRSYLNKNIFDYKTDDFEKKSILVHVCEHTMDTYYSDDVTNPEGKYVDGILFPDPVRSEMIAPIYLENEIVGVVDLYSVKKAFFNPITVAVVEKSMKLFMSSYMTKKRQHVYNHLIKPTETWNNSTEVYHQLVKLLTDYYYTDTICLWVRNTDNSKVNEYRLEEGFPENNAFIELMKENFSQYKTVSDNLKDNLGPDIDLHYNFQKDIGIHRFCIRHKFTFYVSICIRILNRCEVFINIFSKLDIFLNAGDKEKVKTSFLGREYEFLRQISTKVSMSLQNLRLTQALKDMSASRIRDTQNNPNRNLEKIVESAQIATGADIVALFPFYTEKKEIRKKDGILSNGFVSDSEQKAVFADLIFRHTTAEKEPIYNFDDNEECKTFLLQHDTKTDLSAFDSDGFRTTNNIRSSAAVRLEFGTEAVGVMFFNYKEPQNLRENNNLRQIILFFSTFAAYQLYLNRELNSIRIQNKELDEKYAVKAEAFEKMIPLITRTQFYLIVEGVSHIMKNALEGIKDDLDDIDYLSGRDKFHFDDKKKNIQNSLDIIETVLTIFNFRDEQNKKVYVSIEKIIEATIKFFKIRHGDITYTSAAIGEIPYFRCHQAEFAMIIYNLIYNSINAIKGAGRAGGVIATKVELSPEEENYIITVEDNGIGIKHEFDEKIYEPNFSTKKGGTGLGLYYIKKTMDTYNGTITHRSVVREGTLFTLTIPVSNNYID